jgi:hypothetical protein
MFYYRYGKSFGVVIALNTLLLCPVRQATNDNGNQSLSREINRIIYLKLKVH